MKPFSKNNIKIIQGNCHPIASELCIVIDVLRGSSVQFALFNSGVKIIHLAKSEIEAFELKAALPDALLIGEKNGLKIPNFDLGNSPIEVNAHPKLPSEVIHKTTNGTQALLLTEKSKMVYSVGFNGCESLIHFLLAKPKNDIEIVIVASHPTSDEDLAVGEYIKKALITGKTPPSGQTTDRINGSDCAKKYLDPMRPEFSKRDLDLCGSPLNANFLMSKRIKNESVYLTRINL